jgi:antitoxin (DNA-binding transcriptional repressor) of toxin-antitoxin stability system
LRGEEVVIDHAGKPQVRLMPVANATEVDRKERRRRVDEILARADAIPKRPDAFEPIEWDENGLPT